MPPKLILFVLSCNIATLSTLKPLGVQGRGVGAIPGRFFESATKTSHHIYTLGVVAGARA